MRYGDNYLKLALTLGIEPDALRRANGLWHIQSVPAGVRLQIPLAADRSFLLHAALGLTPANAPERAVPAARAPGSARRPVVGAVAPRPSQPPPRVDHRVSRGDTLIGLARRYETTIPALQEANGMGRRTAIRVGQRLRIPGPAREPSPARVSEARRSIAHRVSRGETLTDLAHRYGTTIPAIQQANGMARRTTIRTGETLRIPVPSTEGG
jgi:LysM repeat protein